MADVPVDERSDPRDMAHGDLVAEVDRLREIEEAAREVTERTIIWNREQREGTMEHDYRSSVPVEPFDRLRTALDADEDRHADH